MTPSDAARGGAEPGRDPIQGLAEIVSRGHAAVTVLIDELHGEFGGPLDVRPLPDASTDARSEQIADALGEVRGSIVAVTAERPGLAARIALGLAGRLVDMGAPVTVVDGSIEEPVFAKGLPEDGDEGLVDAVLFGVSSSTVARRTLMHGVSLVTAGSYPISVAAVLGADAYRTTLQKLAREDATVLLVLPESYAPVAAAAASQLVIVGRELPIVERLARDLRSVEDLRDVRFVAVLSAPEPAPLKEVPAPESVPEAAPEVVAPQTLPSGDLPSDIEEAVEKVVAAVSDEDVTREPALVTANTAFAPDPAPEEDDEPPSSGERATGRRWGALIGVIIALLIVGVAWRMGALDDLFSGDEDGSVAVTTTGEVETPAPAEITPADSSTILTDTSELPEPVVPDDTESIDSAGQGQQPASVTETRDWRALSVSSAMPGRYVVFTSSHRLISAADRDAQTLERRGFPSRVVDVDIPERGMWHRVAVDAGFRTLDDTRELLDIMKDVGYEGAWIERLREPAPPVVAPPDTSDLWMDEGSAPQ